MGKPARDVGRGSAPDSGSGGEDSGNKDVSNVRRRNPSPRVESRTISDTGLPEKPDQAGPRLAGQDAPRASPYKLSLCLDNRPVSGITETAKSGSGYPALILRGAATTCSRRTGCLLTYGR